MKNNKTLDTILAVILILGAAAIAVYAFCMGTSAGFIAGCFAASTSLACWLAKRLQNQKEELRERNQELNELYRGAMEQVVNERQVTQDIKDKAKAQMAEMQSDIDYWRALALKSEAPSKVETPEEAPQEPVAAEAPKPEKKHVKSIAEVKATVSKVKKHPSKEKRAKKKKT